MVSERNRVLKLRDYLESLGININIGKTKARGHKGIFIYRPQGFRIDIASSLNSDEALSVMLHEYAHYVHYNYDKTLKSLEFVFNEFSDEIREELIRITVRNVPKELASSLYKAKESVNLELKELAGIIKSKYPNFKLTENLKELEKTFSEPLKYLIKYDNVKYFNSIYSTKNISSYDLTEVQRTYILLKSKQRFLKRINSKINRLNKYYNNPSELFARFTELYYTSPELANKIAPLACKKMKNSNIEQLKNLEKVLNS